MENQVYTRSIGSFLEKYQIRGDEETIPALVLPAFSGSPTELSIPRRTIFNERQQAALEEAARSLRTIQDPETKKSIEISTGNNDATNEYCDLEVATYNSALTTNDGNLVEFSENVSIHPDKRRVYLASPGNGFSSYFDPKEREYIRRTGRFIYETYEGNQQVTLALPTIRAVYRALHAGGLPVDRISTTSSGGNMGTALMYAMPNYQLTHVYMKGRINIVDHNPLMLAYRMLVKENMQAAKQNKANSHDSWALNDERIEQAHELLQPAKSKLKQTEKRLGKFATIAKLFNDGIAYSKGADQRLGITPAASDTRLARYRQPGAKITYHFSAYDQMYRQQYMQLVDFLGMTAIPYADETNVIGLLMPGTHADHTYMPSVKWATERYAFER